MFVSYTSWAGAFIITAVYVVIVLPLCIQVGDKTIAARWLIAIGALLLAVTGYLASMVAAEKLCSLLIFYGFFVGFGEELLFRGYIQTRIATVNPYGLMIGKFRLSYAVIISSLLFGFAHMFNSFDPSGGVWKLEIPWGVWTAASGVVFGIIRERTGTVFVSAMLHGVLVLIPQFFI